MPPSSHAFLADPAGVDDAAVKLDVLRVQRTCVHDGPGIRTVVFFRGCNMRCKWCHNPEAQLFAGADPTSKMSIPQLLDVIARDKTFYTSTHGGVTLSGGDPMLQPRASLVRLLQRLKESGTHVAVETACDAPIRTLEACLPFVDLFLVDLKTAGDDALHCRLTARPLDRVQSHIRQLLNAGARVRFRMCVVPGLNDTMQSLQGVAAFLRDVGQPSIELLRYHNLHEVKAQKLHVAQEPLDISHGMAVSAIERATKTFVALGIEVVRAPEQPGGHRPAFTPRIRAIQQEIRDAGHAVCVESARLKTAYYKQYGFDDPVPVHRARALRYVLNHKQVRVHPHELIVGNFTSKRVGGNVWIEYFATTMAVHFWRMDRQKPVSFACSPKDKAVFYGELLPFWLQHGLVFKTFASVKDFAFFSARTFETRSGFNNNMAAIAHYSVNCERILRLGTSGIAAEVKERAAGADADRAAFYQGVLLALRGLEEIAQRYAARLDAMCEDEPEPVRKQELADMARVCRRVPRYPAQTFHQALQSILFLQIALCTESFENAISLGRLDTTLHPYYEADVRAGRIDYEKARELVACFILKFDEVVFLNDGDSALQLGKLFESLSPVETVTVGGVDRDGKDVTNDVTYMVLDACELGPIGVNMAARIHRGSPDAYVERIAEVYLNGSPMPALFNDDAYVPAILSNYDVPIESSRDYSIVGCVEPVASDDHFANTDCANVNVVLPFLQALTGDTRSLWHAGLMDRADRSLARAVAGAARRRGHERVASLVDRFRQPSLPANLDALMDRFQLRLDALVAGILADHQRIERALGRDFHTPLASSLFPGSIERGKDVYEGGATINTSGIQAVGVTDVADSLLALEEVVFNKKLFTLRQVVRAIDQDFEGEFNQRVREALLSVPKFGDDDAARAHVWVNRVLSAYVHALGKAEHASRDGRYVAGYYGLNVNMVYGKKTPSLPSGRLAGTPLANSICPHYGMQMTDLTSALNAVAKVDFPSHAPNGATLTSTIDAGLFPGREGTRNLAGLIRGYFNQGGMQFQPNLVSRELLLDAYANPGKHKNLVVRIAGYCAYFDDLSDDLKREILGRSYYTQ